MGWGRLLSRLCQGLPGAVVLVLRPCVCGMNAAMFLLFRSDVGVDVQLDLIVLDFPMLTNKS